MVIKSIQDEAKQTYGYRRMKVAIEQKTGRIINKKRVARIQKSLGLQACTRRRRFKYPFTQTAVEDPKDNLLNRDFKAQAPNQKWATDITYIQNGGNRLYLSVILDLFSREIIAYRLSDSFAMPFVLETFKDAFEKQQPQTVLVHSDQGCHYTARNFCEMLRRNNAIQSMSRRGNCWDNAVMENFFGHLKSELVHRLRPCSRQELEEQICNYIEFYNNRRIQLKIRMAPVEYRSHSLQTA
jgi:putative transposase